VCSGRCIQGALIIRYQKSNDSVLGLALGRRDRLRVRVQRQRLGVCQRAHSGETACVGTEPNAKEDSSGSEEIGDQ